MSADAIVATLSKQDAAEAAIQTQRSKNQVNSMGREAIKSAEDQLHQQMISNDQTALSMLQNGLGTVRFA